MIIILEGTERTGKSTLAKELEKEGFISFKDAVHTAQYYSPSMENRIDAITEVLSKMDEAGINVVVDRHHISSYIYAKVYRRGNGAELPTYKFVDALLAKMNTKLYLCERYDDEYYTSHPKLSKKEDIEKLQKQFRYVFDKSEIKRKKIIDISKTDVNLIVDEIIERNVLSEVEDNWPDKDNYKYDFYLASPFFNPEQKEREAAIKEILRSHRYKVYAPFENAVVNPNESSSFCKEVFESNIKAIQESKYVLAITDGKDMGTIWEAGYAYGINKPVIYYAETLGKNPFNIMLSESGYGIFTDRVSLAVGLENGRLNYKEDVKHE